MKPPRTITYAERLARKGQTNPSAPRQPIAQFRVKGGCRTCRPIPVYAASPKAVDQTPK